MHVRGQAAGKLIHTRLTCVQSGKRELKQMY